MSQGNADKQSKDAIIKSRRGEFRILKRKCSDEGERSGREAWFQNKQKKETKKSKSVQSE